MRQVKFFQYHDLWVFSNLVALNVQPVISTRKPIIFRVEISITILDTNITDDIWKIINVK